MDLIERIEHFDSFDAAVADCVYVVGFTARRRAREAAPHRPEGRRRPSCSRRAPNGPVALVFGREDSGLPNEILDRVHATVTIPTTDHASLNLAQAALIALLRAAPRRRRRDADDRAAAQGRAAADATSSSSSSSRTPSARSTAIEFFKTRFPEHIMRTLRSLTFRAAPDARELSLMRAMVIEVTNYLTRRSSRDAVTSIRLTSFLAMPFRRFFDRGDKDRAAEAPPPSADAGRRDRVGRRSAGTRSSKSRRDDSDWRDARARGSADRRVDGQQARRGALRRRRRRRSDALRAGGRLPRHRRRRQRVPRLHHGARLRRARLRRAERHARRRRRDRGGQRVGAVELPRGRSSPSGCAASFRAPITCSFSRPAPKRWPPPCASRARTRRASIVVGSGYFGWLDWSADDAAGVPDGDEAAFSSRSVRRRRRARGGGERRRVATSRRSSSSRSSSGCRRRSGSTRARELATSSGAVLIFDEIKTGFRLRDRRLSAVRRRRSRSRRVRQGDGERLSARRPSSAIATSWTRAKRTWISSTLAERSVGARRGGAPCSTWHDTADVCESLWTIGAEMRRVVAAAIEASGVEGVTVDGIDPMWMLRFDRPERERRFLELAAAHGVLFKRGAYNYRRARARRRRDSRRSKPARARRSSSCATRKPRSDAARDAGAPLAGREPLIDAHAHFLLRRHAGAPIGRTSTTRASAPASASASRITSRRSSARYGFSSPTYFPSPDDVTRGNDAMLAICRARARARAHVRHGESELHRARARARSIAASARGAIGIKLLASRRADDPLLDPIAERRRRARAADPAPHLAAPAPRVAVTRDL